MSLSTSRSRLASVVSGVTGVGNVRVRFAFDIDRADAEAALISGGKVNSWEFAMQPRAVHGGASGLNRIAVRVRGEVLYQHVESSDSFNAFVDLLAAVMAALIEPTTGFPQVGEAGVVLLELTEAPVKTRAGHSCYRARIEFDLDNVDNT